VKRAALPGLAVERHRTVVKHHQSARDRKSQANAAQRPAVVFSRHKRLKDTLLLVGGHAQTGVLDPKVQVRRHNLCAKCDVPALGKSVSVA
jgi:hypothetical protein